MKMKRVVLPVTPAVEEEEEMQVEEWHRSPEESGGGMEAESSIPSGLQAVVPGSIIAGCSDEPATVLCMHVSVQACMRDSGGPLCGKAHMAEAELISALRSSKSVQNVLIATNSPKHKLYKPRHSLL
jgi:hypothetical protein